MKGEELIGTRWWCPGVFSSEETADTIVVTGHQSCDMYAPNGRRRVPSTQTAVPVASNIASGWWRPKDAEWLRLPEGL